MNMDIHFSDEEDYNSGAEENWDEYDTELEYDNTITGSKEVVNKKKNMSKDEKNEGMDPEEMDADEIENNENQEEEMEADNDMEEMEADEEIDETEADNEMEEIEADAEEMEEYYPEEDAGNKEEIVVKEEDRITSDVLSKYEMVELISIRATQISKGDHPFVEVNGLRDPISMAKKELYENRCPLLVKRHIGNNMYEYWNPNNMSKPKI